MDLTKIADETSALRRAAGLAESIAGALHKIKAGPTFDHERDALVAQVDNWLVGLANHLGYSAEKRA